MLELPLRRRSAADAENPHGHATISSDLWRPETTAALVCDMWDRHWCYSAERRVAEMIPAMAAALAALRDRGVFILHCPSDTRTFYRDSPAYAATRAAITTAPFPERSLPAEPPLPIDDSDGGCDCATPCPIGEPWTRQHPALPIQMEDGLAFDEDALHLLRSRGVTSVLLMGVHTNMCVLRRPFGIRRLMRHGWEVALVRDLTDTMYNPRQPPFVSHVEGTRLVLSHIERNLCPTVSSAAFTGAESFRFAGDPYGVE